MMPNLLTFGFVALFSINLVPAARADDAAPAKPPLAPVKPVVDDYFGIKVTDSYRYLENLDDPQVQSWMKAQADYTRSVLDKIPGRQGMLDDIVKYVNGAPATVTDLRRVAGGRYFFLKTLAGQSLGKLYMRQGVTGKDVLLVDTDHFSGAKGEPAAINYYEPSRDGRYVAYGVSQGGSEMATVHIMDVDAKKDFDETIDRAEFGGVAWRPDNQSFYYNRLQKLAPNSSPLDKYRNNKVFLHHLGDAVEKDAAVFGIGLSPDVKMTPEDIPFIQIQPGSNYAIGAIEHGVQLENTLYAAPLDSLDKPQIPWTKLVDVDADVTDFTIKDNQIYLLTHKDASRFQIMHVPLDNAGQAQPQSFLPQTAGVVKSLTAAADALYVAELDDGVYHILRVPYVGAPGSPARVELPFEGAVDIYPSDPRVPGIAFETTSWTKGPRINEYDPETKQVTLTDIRPAGPYDNLDDLTSLEVKAPSYDGTMVPLSIVSKKGIALDGKNPTIVWAYGAYGITEDPGFGGSWLAWMEHGGIFAVAHVRGGGERGEDWHKAAYKLTKPNTWRDTIACGKYLVDQNYTTSSRMGVMGGSAGGITVGRTITERPDLFAAAVPMAGVLNALRAENSPNGPPNIPEFGSSKTQEGFEDLFAMDAYQHVRDGVAYPASLITTGINDPRVSPWEPAKMAARMQAATQAISSKSDRGGKPILLRVDYQGGHGIGASRKQREEEYADEFSFFLWQFGAAGFQPGQ